MTTTTDDKLEAAAVRLESARTDLDDALSNARQAALDALSEGEPEAAVARKLRVTRMAIRRWAGK